MNILLCPDKFKGSISAQKVCHALSQGLLIVDPGFNIVKHPMADGGDGSIEILKEILSLKAVNVDTLDPLGRKIKTQYYKTEDSAFIELASASGIVLLEAAERNPLLTTTVGTGIMIKHAIDCGLKKIYLFIGGSATNDGGVGIAHALGFRFLDSQGLDLEPIGAALEKISSIENKCQYDFESVEITVLCDVSNPMYGPNGAAFTYGAQKGASQDEILVLDKGLENYAEVLKSHVNKDLSTLAGMGAAGAVGASLLGLFNAKIKNGFAMLSEATQLEAAIKQADLVITGEGKIDHTSFQGKVVGNVYALCKKYAKPCGIVGGVIERGIEVEEVFDFHKSIITLASNQKEAMTHPEKFLVEIGKEIGILLRNY